MLREKQLIELAVLCVVVTVVILGIARFKTTDIDFSKKVFAGLVNGSPGVRNLIDWENFQALGADLGATYRTLPDAAERSNYEKMFIRSFSLNFKKSGGRFAYFKQWRLQKKDAQIAIVAADEQRYNKTALFFISRYPKKKLVGIVWQEGVK